MAKPPVARDGDIVINLQELGVGRIVQASATLLVLAMWKRQFGRKVKEFRHADAAVMSSTKFELIFITPQPRVSKKKKLEAEKKKLEGELRSSARTFLVEHYASLNAARHP